MFHIKFNLSLYNFFGNQYQITSLIRQSLLCYASKEFYNKICKSCESVNKSANNLNIQRPFINIVTQIWPSFPWKNTYSGDLNNEHLNNGNIWITNFHLSGIQMSGIQMVVGYSDHHLNTGPVFKWHSNNRPFGDRTTIDHLNTRLVQYSDPHCIMNTVVSSFDSWYHAKMAHVKQTKLWRILPTAALFV